MSDNANMRYRILSIDGGPAAPLQIRILRKLEQAYPGFLASTHQFAGTSDGALIALFLASRLPKDFEAAKRISLDVLDDAITFSNATIRALQPTTYSTLRFLSGMGALVDVAPLRRILEQAFGDMKLADLERDCHVTLFSVDGMSGESVVKLGKFCPLNWNVVDVLLATSALPMYMPLHRIENERYVDGVISANDSTFNAVTATAFICSMRAQEIESKPPSPPLPSSPSELSPELNAMVARARSPSLEERCAGFRVLSLGLQQHNRSVYVSETLLKRYFGDRFSVYDEKTDWGWFQWLMNRPRLLPAMIYGAGNDNMSFLLEQLFLRIYFRYAPSDEVIGEVWRVMTRHAQELLDHAEELATVLWQQGIECKSPYESPPQTSSLMDFVKAEWFDTPVLPEKPNVPASPK